MAAFFQPLLPWFVRRLMGPGLGRAMALSLGRPTLGTTRAAWEELGQFLEENQLRAPDLSFLPEEVAAVRDEGVDAMDKGPSQ